MVVRTFLDPDDFESDHSIRLRLVGPDGSLVVPPMEQTVERSQLQPLLPAAVEGEQHALQMTFVLGGVTFPTAGLFEFALDVGGEAVGRYPLPVILAST